MATYTARTLTIVKGDDTYLIDPLQGNENGYTDLSVTIHVNDWSSTAPYTYVYSNIHITSRSVIDVYFKDGIRGGLVGDLKFTKTTGQVTFVTTEPAVGDIPLLIRVLDATVNGVFPIDAEMVETDAIVGETTVQRALESLDNGKVDKVTNKGLSTEDYTSAEKTKLEGIATGATKNTVSDSLTDTSTTNALSAAKGKVLNDATLHYGKCTTAAATAEKDVTITNFPSALAAGQKVRIWFTKAQTATTPTLKINSLDAKNIVQFGTTAALAYEWKANAVVDFMYDGTSWVIVNGGHADASYFGKVKLTNTYNTSSPSAAADGVAASQKAVADVYSKFGSLITPEVASGVTIEEGGYIVINSSFVIISVKIKLTSAKAANENLIIVPSGKMNDIPLIMTNTSNLSSVIPCRTYGGYLVSNIQMATGTYIISGAYLRGS